MRKLSLLIFYKEYQDFLEELRDRGVVHIHENKKRSAEDETLKQKVLIQKRVGEMIRMLSKRIPESKERIEELLERWSKAIEPAEKMAFYQQVFYPNQKAEISETTELELLAFLESQFKRMEYIDQQIASLEKDGAVYAPWGDLPVERIKGLENAGWDLRFFMTPGRKYLPEWEEKYNAFVVNEEKGQKYFVTLSPKTADENPEADRIQFPTLSADEIRQRVGVLQNEKGEVANNLERIATFSIDYLKSLQVQLQEDADLLKVKGAAQSLLEDKVIALEGWVPESIAVETDQWLANKGVAYELAEPVQEDNPPILLKNNKFARLFEFIGELYSLPNYREIDLTPFFAPFFVLFFGLCLGDAGYGLFILLGVSIYKLKAKEAIKPVLSLAQWLGLSTVIMGLVGGTFFGIQFSHKPNEQGRFGLVIRKAYF
jgi:V/A-type H+-transporting ATPase subunit I